MLLCENKLSDWDQSQWIKIYPGGEEEFVSVRPDGATEGPSSSRWYLGTVILKKDENAFLYLNQDLNLELVDKERDLLIMLKCGEGIEEKEDLQDIFKFIDYCETTLNSDFIEIKEIVAGAIFEC